MTARLATARRPAPGAWAVSAVVVTVGALAQGLLVLGDPNVEASVGFVLLTVASALALAVEVWCLAAATSAGPSESARAVWGRVIRRPVVLAWVLGLMLLVGLAAVYALALVPLVLLVGVLLLPPVAAGERNPFVAAVAVVRRHPWRFVLLVLCVALAIVLGWVVALLLGFFVTGAVAAFGAWFWIGWSVVLVLRQSSRLFAASGE